MKRRSLVIAAVLGMALGVVALGGSPVGPDPTGPAPGKLSFKVFYFHGKFRCPTCLKIEALSARAVQESFQGELQRGSLEWRAVDVDKPENRHFDREFALESSTLAVARYEGDKLGKYRKLEKVWELVEGDEQLFVDYVRAEIERFMAE